MCSFLHFAGQVLYLAHLQICCECQRISQVSYLSPEFGCAMWASMTTLQTPQHLQKWHLVDHVYWNSCTRMEKQQQTFQFDLAFTARSHYLLSLMEVALGLSFSSPWSTYYTLLSTNKCFLPFYLCRSRELALTPTQTLTRKRCWFRRRRLRTLCFSGADSPWRSASSPWLWSLCSDPDTLDPRSRC